MIVLLSACTPEPPGPTVDEVVAWAQSGSASGSVSLADRGIEDATFAEALERADFPTGVRSLTVNGNRLGPASMTALAGRCDALRWLNLTGNPLGDDGARALAASGCLSGLESLFLHDAGVGTAGALALVDAGMPNLSQLVAGHQPIGTPAARGLADLSALRRLELPGVAMDGAGARALIAGTTAAALSLDGTPLGAGALTGLGGISPHLTDLDLARCGLTAADVVALATVEGADLKTLDLTGNPLGDDGLRALAATPWLTRLEKLVVEGSGASLEVRKALVDAWGPRGGIKVERR